MISTTVALIAVPSCALAAGQAASPDPREPAVDAVVVTAEKAQAAASIDRKTYSTANDVVGKSGSAIDLLRSIPSVDVDAQGSVSLRGNPRVTILIDGKPSSLLNGEGRGDALGAIPGSQIDRIEVMTNPSAANRVDGDAGIINLVSRPNDRQGLTGSMRANVGASRVNLGLGARRKTGRLTLSGDASYRNDRQPYDQSDERAQFADGGALQARSQQRGDFETDGGSLNLRSGAQFEAGRDNFGLDLGYRNIAYDTDGRETHDDYGSDGTQTAAYDRLTTEELERDQYSLAADWRRRLQPDGRELSARLSHEINDASQKTRAVTSGSTSVPGYEAFGWRSEQETTNFKLDYVRPFSGRSTIKAGLDFEALRHGYVNFARSGDEADDLQADLGRTNAFRLRQDVWAAYATIERPFGKLTVEGGVRVEQASLEMVVGDAEARRDKYLRAYPSAHLSYALSDSQSLVASASRRIQRPSAQDLDPGLAYVDPYNYTRGNIGLKPQRTDGIEAGWQRQSGPSMLSATLYYRKIRGQFADRAEDFGDGVVVSTRENLGRSDAYGIEWIAAGKASAKLSYNLSLNLAETSLAFDGGDDRSGTSLSGRAILGWQVSGKDFIQVMAGSSGRRLSAQGFSRPVQMMNIGYRRKVDDKINFVVSIVDAGNSFSDTTIIDTPQLYDRFRRRARMRTMTVGLTYTFGGGKSKDQGFDFSPGGANGGE